jgi:hypothetical protein
MPSKTPIAKNTATLEYFAGNISTDTSSTGGDIDWPSSSSSSPKPASSSSPKNNSNADDEQPPSPAPSNIVLAAHLDDTLALCEENRKMAERGVESGERKKVLLEMQEERVERRRKEYEEDQERMRRDVERETEGK